MARQDALQLGWLTNRVEESKLEFRNLRNSIHERERGDVQIDLERARLWTLYGRVLAFSQMTGAWPKELEDLTRRQGKGTVQILGPLSARYLFADSWGRSYRYLNRGMVVEIESAGWDGVFGTSDDILLQRDVIKWKWDAEEKLLPLLESE